MYQGKVGTPARSRVGRSNACSDHQAATTSAMPKIIQSGSGIRSVGVSAANTTAGAIVARIARNTTLRILPLLETFSDREGRPSWLITPLLPSGCEVVHTRGYCGRAATDRLADQEPRQPADTHAQTRKFQRRPQLDAHGPSSG